MNSVIELDIFYVLLFQVKTNLVTINPRQGERAVLIKNNEGDWGVVMGKWTDFRKGVAEVPGNLYVTELIRNIIKVLNS